MKEQPFTKEEGEKAAQKHSLGEKKKGLKKKGKRIKINGGEDIFYSFFFSFSLNFKLRRQRGSRDTSFQIYV